MQTVERSVSRERNSGEVEKSVNRESQPPTIAASIENQQENVIFDPSTSDPFQIYINEISRYPLITHKREVDLRRKIRFCDVKISFFQEVLNSPIREETEKTEALHLRYSENAKRKVLKDEFMNSNLRLVVSVAKKYQDRGVALMDLIQEGNLGLDRAVELFDENRGNKFSTYATWWIRQSILRSIGDDARTVRLPVHKIEEISRMGRATNRLAHELGRYPTNEEVAEELKISVGQVKELLSISRKAESLDTAISDENEVTRATLIEDKETNVENIGIQQAEAKEVQEAVELLTSSRERLVIRMRFGMGEWEHAYTLEEIGKELGRTREGIRQIEAKAIKNLKNIIQIKRLRD